MKIQKNVLSFYHLFGLDHVYELKAFGNYLVSIVLET